MPVFWLLVICVVLLFFGIYFKDELHKKWLHSGGMEDVTFQGLTSKLEDQGNCYLCGSSDYSLVDVFRKSGRIGVILLNDWNFISKAGTKAYLRQRKGTELSLPEIPGRSLILQKEVIQGKWLP